MNRIIALALILAFAYYGYTSHLHPTNPWSSPLETCDLVIDAGEDTTLCTPGSRVDFQPSVSQSDIFQVFWSPGTAVNDSTELNTFGNFDQNTTLNLTVKTIQAMELITNGDFSQGNTGFTTDYDLGNSSSNIGILAPENTYAITTNPNSVHRRFASCTNHAGTPQIMVVNGSGIANNVWCQEVTVEPNQEYVFSAWLASMTDENPARLQFSINGTLLGDELQAAPTTCIWRQFFATWNSGNSTRAEICIVNVNNNPAGNDFALDDISFRNLCVASDSIQVNVVSLNPTWSGPAQICPDEAPIVLNDFLDPEATRGGVWTLNDVPLDTLNPAIIPGGEYQLTYTLQEAQCTEELSQDIRIISVASSGVATDTAEVCLPTNDLITLADLLEGEDPGGSWMEVSTVSSTGNAFDATQGTFIPSGQLSGMYTFRYTQTAPAGCNDLQTDVSVTINPAPTANAGEDMTLDCRVDMLTIGSSATSSGSEFAYEWTAAGIAFSNESFTEVSQGGTYILQVRNTQTGCTALDTVIITADQAKPQIFAQLDNISCPGLNDGQIRIDSVIAGLAPYSFFLNGSPLTNPQSIGDLAPGTYVLSVEDGNGCIDSRTFDLTSPLAPQFDLESEEVGDSTLIQISTDLNVTDIQLIEWTPPGISCVSCFSLMVKPNVPTLYSARIIDGNGCEYTADININGTMPEQNILFIPNAFSPNEDANNDHFTIFSAKGQANNIVKMQIVDRWGNLVFSKQNFPPDEPTAGWDGTFNGERLNPGVFIFFAEVELADGSSMIVQGDVALIY